MAISLFSPHVDTVHESTIQRIQVIIIVSVMPT